jgi:hypothetical protein
MMITFLKKISVVSLLLFLLPLQPSTAYAVTDYQDRQIRLCYAKATLYEIFANRYIKGYTKRQSISFVRKVDTTSDVSRTMIKIVKTTYRDRPSSKFKYAIGKLHQCHRNNISIVSEYTGSRCYLLKGILEVISNAKKKGKTYEQAMSRMDAILKSESTRSLARALGKAVYSSNKPVRGLQKSSYLTCVRASLANR